MHQNVFLIDKALMGLKNATLQLAYLSGTVFQIKLMSWDNPV